MKNRPIKKENYFTKPDAAKQIIQNWKFFKDETTTVFKRSTKDKYEAFDVTAATKIKGKLNTIDAKNTDNNF